MTPTITTVPTPYVGPNSSSKRSSNAALLTTGSSTSTTTNVFSGWIRQVTRQCVAWQLTLSRKRANTKESNYYSAAYEPNETLHHVIRCLDAMEYHADQTAFQATSMVSAGMVEPFLRLMFSFVRLTAAATATSTTAATR